VRLFDQVVQHPEPFLVRHDDGSIVRLTSAGDFAGLIERCPLRYVLADQLARDCTALAYSDGVHLAECLDLVHMPSREWWVEWNDAARLEEYRRAMCDAPPERELPPVARAGVLVSAAASGRSGVMRSFWSDHDAPDDPLLAPVEVHFDLDCAAAADGSLEALLAGGCAAVPIVAEPGVSAVLQRARYRFDASWLRYYDTNAASASARRQVLQASLGSVIVDFPMVIALLLMMTVRGGLPQRRGDLSRLNAKRSRLGRSPLLEHIEISSPIVPERWSPPDTVAGAWRRAPRFHHVRGHLVRRANALFWRTPHWRGHLRLGQVRSRTVALHS
jgi:hypothetical protein